MTLMIIFCAAAIGGIILWILFNLKFKNGKESVIPGPSQATNEELGHLNEIRKSGGLHLYLKCIHKKYGPVVTFYIGKIKIVSLASAECFRKVQHVFDRPAVLFENHLQVIGKGSIQFANGLEGQERHKKLSRPFSFMECTKYYENLTEIAMELARKIKVLSRDSHIPIQKHTNVFAIQSIVSTAFGQLISEDTALEFYNNYNIMFQENENFFFEQPENKEPNADKVKTAISASRKFVQDLLQSRLERRHEDSRELFVDLILDYGWTREKEVDNAITFLIGGFHTTANLLTWMLYYTANYKNVQEKLHAEILSVLGASENVTHETMPKLKYMQQVIEETLRAAVVAPYAARCSSKHITIGEYVIPANTPILLALGVVQTNEEYWTHPNKFDPDRFETENSNSSKLVFTPFGFAGKRICPGYRLNNVEIVIAMSLLLKLFSFELVEGQDIKHIHGLVTKPSSEIWMIVNERTKTEN